MDDDAAGTSTGADHGGGRRDSEIGGAAGADHDERQGAVTDADRDAAIETYWALARKRVGINRLDVVIGQVSLGTVVPPAWAFGGTPEEADALLELVLSGRKTASTSARWEYDDEAPLPAVGDLSILLDGRGRPRALVATTVVDVVPFGEVGEDHAAAEGEGDGSLKQWRRAHEEFFRAQDPGAPVSADMPVVLERFRLIDPIDPRPDRPVPPS